MNVEKVAKQSFYDVLFADNKLFKLTESTTKFNEELSKNIRTIIYVHQHINEVLEEQISKIMMACKLQKDEYLIISIDTGWKEIRNHSNIKEIILFGDYEKTINLSVNLPRNYPFPFDQKIWIKTYELDQIMSNNQLKNDFWHQGLKPYYLQ